MVQDAQKNCAVLKKEETQERDERGNAGDGCCTHQGMSKRKFQAGGSPIRTRKKNWKKIQKPKRSRSASLHIFFIFFCLISLNILLILYCCGAL